MVKILALREKFEHMSNHSGYDVLYQYLGQDIAVDTVNANFKKIYPRGIGRMLAGVAKITSPSGFYNAQSVEAETVLLIRSLRQKYNVIHYSYGEPYWGLGSVFRKRLLPSVVITNHQPVSWWETNKPLFKKYAGADKVIALSEHDRDYFNDTVSNKAIFIPHGVDTDFFKPAASKPGSDVFRVVFAGRYLRDMPTLSAVITTLSSTGLDIQFDLITAANEPYLKGMMLLPNVNFHNDISDVQLLALYQQAHCCLIPLLDCTANNAILEAMACGLPVIATDLPAIKSYLDDSCSILAGKQSIEDLCQAIKSLYHDSALLEKMGNAARTKVLTQFSWPIVGTSTADLFKSLA